MERTSVPCTDMASRVVAPPLVRLAEITPTIAGAVSDLGSWANRDSAEMLIVTNARVYGGVLLTLDEMIRSSGLVEVVCKNVSIQLVTIPTILALT